MDSNSRGATPIKVIRIIDRLNIGGPTKHVTWLTSGVNPGRFFSKLITGTVPPGEGDMSYFAKDAGIEPFVISEMSRELSPRDILVIFKLVKELFRFKPQIIHTHKAKAGAVGRLAAIIYKWLTPSAFWLRSRPCRVVHTYHGHVFHSYYGKYKTRLFLAIERLLAILATDRIIVISEQQRKEICEHFAVGKPGQYRVIPLGLDLEVPDPGPAAGKLRDTVSISGGIPLIGIVGRLCEIKNHTMFLDAASRLERQGKKARYVIIGDGHLKDRLVDYADKLGITDRVIFTGFRNDVTGLYADLDIAALTSLNEGTPLTLIEAMNCGIGVVATEVGGVVDLMGKRRGRHRDGFEIWDHGITAPSRDVDIYAKALGYLIDRRDVRTEMGSRGRAFVREKLSKERLISDIESLYRELLDD